MRYCICIFICAHSQVEVGKGGFVRWVVRWVGEEEATSERVPEKKTLTLTPKLVPENNTSNINTGKSPWKGHQWHKCTLYDIVLQEKVSFSKNIPVPLAGSSEINVAMGRIRHPRQNFSKLPPNGLLKGPKCAMGPKFDDNLKFQIPSQNHFRGLGGFLWKVLQADQLIQLVSIPKNVLAMNKTYLWIYLPIKCIHQQYISTNKMKMRT